MLFSERSEGVKCHPKQLAQWEETALGQAPSVVFCKGTECTGGRSVIPGFKAGWPHRFYEEGVGTPPVLSLLSSQL